MSNLHKVQKGFSITEVLLVVAIVMTIAAIGIPSLLSSREAAGSIAITSDLRVMHSNQIIFRSTRGRYGNLNEMNEFSNKQFGKSIGTALQHKGWILAMSPTPTSTTLRFQYQTYAYKMKNGRVVSAYVITQDGIVHPVLSPITF